MRFFILSILLSLFFIPFSKAQNKTVSVSQFVDFGFSIGAVHTNTISANEMGIRADLINGGQREFTFEFLTPQWGYNIGGFLLIHLRERLKWFSPP